jgi:hypothetical protein
MRGTEDAGTRSRSTHEVERALDTEAVDPLTRRAGTPREIATPEETAARGGVAAPEKAAAVPVGPPRPPRPTHPPPGPRSTDELALAELRQIAELQARDREVRAHEQAHKAVAGPHGGAMSFQYQTGPDGRKYAVGGEVAVDLSTVRGDPQATIDKMEQVRRAALAPAEPSSTDRAVARARGGQAEQARAELRTERDAAEKATAAVEGARTRRRRHPAARQPTGTGGPGRDGRVALRGRVRPTGCPAARHRDLMRPAWHGGACLPSCRRSRRRPPLRPLPRPGPPGPEGAPLIWGEWPDPSPAAGEVVLRIVATAVNRADLLQVRGLYPPPPGASPILGLEAAGYVEQVGAG